MAGGRLQRLRHGDKLRDLSASTWNRFVDAVEWIDRFKNGQEDQATYARDGNAYAKNECLGALSQFSVVGIRDILFGPSANLAEFKQNFAFRIREYDESTDGERWGIVQEPCGYGSAKVVPVKLSGPSVCKIKVEDESHKFAKPIEGDTSQLISNAETGVPILWKESGTGNHKWAVVTLDRTAPAGATIQWIRIDTGETLTPGSICYGRRVKYTIDAGWEDVDEEGVQVVVSNQYQDVIENDETTGYAAGDVFAIAGEIVPTYFDANLTTDSAPGGYDLSEGGYTTIGPFGLRRYAKVTETASPGLPAIPVGSSGEVTIYYGGTAGGVDEPIITSPAITVQAAVLEWNQTRGAAEDEKVVIVWQQDQNRWVIEFLPDSPKLIFFSLEENRASTFAEQSLDATIEFSVRSELATGDTVSVWFLEDEWPVAMTGDKGTAEYDPITEKWWVIRCDESNIRRFSLTSSLTVGGNAPASFMTFSGGSYTVSANTLTLYDSMSVICDTLPSGSKGHCKFYRDSERWELL